MDFSKATLVEEIVAKTKEQEARLLTYNEGAYR
jgi:hypothetical protein